MDLFYKHDFKQDYVVYIPIDIFMKEYLIVLLIIFTENAHFLYILSNINLINLEHLQFLQVKQVNIMNMHLNPLKII